MSYGVLRDGIILFLVALLIRISYVYFFVELEYLSAEDQAMYIQLAKNFSNSGFLGMTTERVPGYPFFVSIIYSLFGESAWNIVFIQLILDSITCIVIALMAKLLFNRGFWIAGALSAINLNMIILSAALLTDTLFLFLFVLFLFSLIKYLQGVHVKWLSLLALFISLATLVRPSSYYLLPLVLFGLIGWRLWHKDNILKIGKLFIIYIVIIGVFLGGIHQRNYQQYGSKALVSQTGKHFLGWVVPAAYQYSGQGSYQEGQAIAKERLSANLQRDNLLKLPLNPFESSSYQANIGKDVLLEFGIVNILKAWATGSLINVLAPSSSYAPMVRSMKHPSFYQTKGNGVIDKLLNYVQDTSGALYLSILVVGTISSVVFLLLSVFGIYRSMIILPPITIASFLLLIVYFFLITGPIIGTKYRLPIEPILTLFAAYFLSMRFNK